MPSEKIAIIGGGVAGLTAGYLLHDLYDVTLFEKENRLGGNVYTLRTKTGEVIDISVFFWSPLLYPNFRKLLERLGIKLTTRPTEGTIQSYRNLLTHTDYFLSCDLTKPRLLFSWNNLKSLKYQMIVFWYYLKTIQMYRKGKMKGMTVGEALSHFPGLSGDVLKIAIFPICIMTSMLWEELMAAPAEFVFSKIEKQLGTPWRFASWRLYPCKTEVYVEKLAAPFKDGIQLKADILSVARKKDGVVITMKDGGEYMFDKVIFACPADTALKLLSDPSEDEQRLLSAWKFKDGLVIVHTDRSNYPREDLWGMYSYLYTDEDGRINTSINAHYRFQNGVPDDSEYIGCQHPNIRIDPEKIEFQKVFRTPFYDHKSVATLSELPGLNGKKNTYYCGSWFGYGLHEDAVTSAIQVATALGASWD